MRMMKTRRSPTIRQHKFSSSFSSPSAFSSALMSWIRAQTAQRCNQPRQLLAKQMPRGQPRDVRSRISLCLMYQNLTDWTVCRWLNCIHLNFMETRSLSCISKQLGRILSKFRRGLVQPFRRRISQRAPRMPRILTCKYPIFPSRVARKRGTSSRIPPHQKGSGRISFQRRGMKLVLSPSNDFISCEYAVYTLIGSCLCKI